MSGLLMGKLRPASDIICLFARAYTQTYRDTHTRVLAHTHTHTHTHTHRHRYAHCIVCKHAHKHTQTDAHTHTRANTQAHTDTGTRFIVMNLIHHFLQCDTSVTNTQTHLLYIYSIQYRD
jgi:hypothetical protein